MRWALRLAEAAQETFRHGGEKHALVHLPAEGASLKEVERHAILLALNRCGWNQRMAADLLRVSQRVMSYKIHHTHQLKPPVDLVLTKEWGREEVEADPQLGE